MGVGEDKWECYAHFAEGKSVGDLGFKGRTAKSERPTVNVQLSTFNGKAGGCPADHAPAGVNRCGPDKGKPGTGAKIR